MGWNAITGEKDKLVAITTDAQPLSPDDPILFLQCLTLVMTDIMLYEDSLTNVDEEIKELIEDHSAAGYLLRVMKELSCWKLVTDKTKTSKEKLEAITSLRKCSWGAMCKQADDLLRVMQKFPMIDDPNELSLVIQCVSLVVLELDLREEEEKISKENK